MKAIDASRFIEEVEESRARTSPATRALFANDIRPPAHVCKEHDLSFDDDAGWNRHLTRSHGMVRRTKQSQTGLLSSRATQRALSRLRDLHRAEYTALLAEERQAVGLGPSRRGGSRD